MKATFYYNHSDARVMNKNLEWVVDLDITFREGESINTPSILLELNFDDNKTLFGVVDSNNEDVVVGIDNDELMVNVPYSITDLNYCYIPILNRYYYITNVTILTNNLYRFELSEDVLMSFKDSILVLDAFVTRNEYTFNALVKDDLVSYYYDKNIEYYDLNEGGDTKFNTNSNYKTNNISLCVINNKRSVVSDTTRPTTPSDDNSSPYFWNGGIIAYNNVYCADVEDINGLSKWLVDDNTLATFVLKMTVYPFELKGYGGISHLWLGDTELVASGSLPTINVNELICPQGDFYTICNKRFIVDDSFLNYEPYTKYELYIPYLSYIPVDADKIINKYIKISYALDYKSGNAQVYVISDNKVIFTSECQLGVDIPVNSTNSLQVQNNKISNAMGLSLGLLGGAVGMFTGNPLAVVGGVLSTTKSVASFINNANTNYNNASGNYASANGGLFGKSTPHLRITRYKIKDYNNDYFKLYGKPLNKVVKLNTLTGFTTIDEIHLENIKCNESEKNEIYSLLKNGVIL